MLLHFYMPIIDLEKPVGMSNVNLPVAVFRIKVIRPLTADKELSLLSCMFPHLQVFCQNMEPLLAATIMAKAA